MCVGKCMGKLLTVLSDVCSNPVYPRGLSEGSGGGLCAVLSMKNVYWSCTVDVVQ
jgi:hypothetical protein